MKSCLVSVIAFCCLFHGNAQSLTGYQDSLRSQLEVMRQMEDSSFFSQKALEIWCEDAKGFVDATGSFNGFPEKAYKSVLSERGQGGPVIDWKWTEVGPSQQPIELNPGGSAIPAYALNRGNGTGRINYLYVDPVIEGRVFACSPTGGLFVTENNGETWRNAGTDQLPVSGVSSIAVNPLNPQQWLISTGDGDDKFMFSDGVWRTSDNGKSWENINGQKNGRAILPSERQESLLYIAEIVAHPCDFNRVFAATSEGLYATDNALDIPEKVRWKKIAPSFFYDILILPENPAVVIAGGERFFVSNDCGASWDEHEAPNYKDAAKFPFRRLTLQASTSDPNLVWVGVSCAEKFSQSPLGAAELQTYNIKTRSWKFVRSLNEQMNNLTTTRGRAFVVSPVDEKIIMVANVQPIYRSIDGGVKFERIDANQMHDDVHHILFEQNGTTVWASHDGGVSRSTDGGITWYNRDFGIGVSNVFGLDVAQSDTLKVLFGAYDTGCTLGTDMGWYHATWGDGFETIIDPKDAMVMYTSKQNGILNRSDDGGLTFEKVVSPRATRSDWHTWIRCHPKRTEVLFCAGDKLMRSFDKGAKWDPILDVKAVCENCVNVYKFFLSESNPNVMYAYVLDESKVNPLLFRTNNLLTPNPEDVKWTEVARIPRPGWLSAIVIDPDNPLQFWLAYKDADPDGKLYRFNGDRYIDISRNLGWAVINALVLDDKDNERLYIGTNHGVFTRNRLEYDFTLMNGLPGTWVRSMVINEVTRELFIGTHGRGVWRGSLLNP
ncbi:MAG: hypothetical protein NWR73_12035 [Flavobacteriales bacterium]|nr:hypothetical protein [Flavobacteriales bacterium]